MPKQIPREIVAENALTIESGCQKQSLLDGRENSVFHLTRSIIY